MNPAANKPYVSGSGTVVCVVICNWTMQRGQTPSPEESKIYSLVGLSPNVVTRPPIPNVVFERIAATPAPSRVIDRFVPAGWEGC